MKKKRNNRLTKKKTTKQDIQEAWDSISPDVQEVILQEMAIEKWDGKLPETMVGTEFLEWLMGSINSSNSTNP